MTSQRKIEANRRNSRKSGGPRTATGKTNASRNAMRHGLAAIVHRQPAPTAEIERLARAICGDDNDPALFAQAVIIADNELVLRAISEQQVAVVERLRDITADPLAKGDNSLALARTRFERASLAYDTLASLLPHVTEKHKDEVIQLLKETKTEAADWEGEIVPLYLKALLRRPESTGQGEGALELPTTQIKERDEFEALEAAAPDLVRLDRYQRRAWSRQKRAIRNFIKIKLMGQSGLPVPPT